MIHMFNNPYLNLKRFASLILVFGLLVDCTLAPSTPASSPIPFPTVTLPPGGQGLSADEIATLSSLTQLDDFPLYSLHFAGVYPPPVLIAVNKRQDESARLTHSNTCQVGWGCSLFAALGDPASRMYGRNFDWQFSPALLLFTDPPNGYASVSMVDIEYLGFSGNRSKNLTSLTLYQRQELLLTPSLPFDGMNAQGLVVAMATVPPGEMRPDPDKKTISQLAVMREILDHAATVDEAVRILSGYNINMGSVPLHYLVASAAGDAALVEFYQGKMVVIRNENPWLHATNFLVASTGGNPQGQCPRYDRISQRLLETGGRLTTRSALDLLSEVAQGDPQSKATTQWSVVYDLTNGGVNIVMGRKYSNGAHTLHLSLKSP